MWIPSVKCTPFNLLKMLQLPRLLDKAQSLGTRVLCFHLVKGLADTCSEESIKFFWKADDLGSMIGQQVVETMRLVEAALQERSVLLNEVLNTKCHSCGLPKSTFHLSFPMQL